MANQVSVNNNSFPLILGGVGFIKDTQTILTDAARTVVLKQFTIMAQIASSGKWFPWLNANLGDNTGLQYPMGIFMGDDIAGATMAAADVTGQNIMYAGHGCEIDVSQLVFDKGSTGVGTAPALTNVPTVPTGLAMQAEQILAMKGLIPVTTVAGDNFEN